MTELSMYSTIDVLHRPHLPSELILSEILILLPVKNLARFKLVCKTWNSMISSPRFSRLHHIRWTSNPEVLPQCAFIVSTEKFTLLNYEAYDEVTSSGDDDMETKTLVETCGSNPYGSNVILIGSCNGLVCLDTNHKSSKCDIRIFNPCTAQSCRVSDPIKNFGGCLLFGFGYVSSLDDYKVVILGLDGQNSSIYVYSLRSKQWKIVVDQFDEAEFPVKSADNTGVLVGETLHWGCQHYWSGTKAVVGFNLVDETFKDVNLPNLGSSDMMLCVMGGCLCVWCKVSYELAEVWMLREYGDWNSWSKLFEMDLLPLEPDWCLKLLSWTKSGKLLLMADDHQNSIVLAHLNPTPTEYLRLLQNLCIVDAVSYVKTLVSPFSY